MLRGSSWSYLNMTSTGSPTVCTPQQYSIFPLHEGSGNCWTCIYKLMQTHEMWLKLKHPFPMCTLVHSHTHLDTYTHKQTITHTHTHTEWPTPTYHVLTQTWTHRHTDRHTDIHRYMDTHTHTHTHTLTVHANMHVSHTRPQSVCALCKDALPIHGEQYYIIECTVSHWRPLPAWVLSVPPPDSH